LRLLVFNLVVDEDDPVLGFACGWLRALAARTERLDVITMFAARADLPDNAHVHSVGKERGYSDPRRVLEFYRLLSARLAAGTDACFSHMMPLFSMMAGPVLRAAHRPLVTWYAHSSLTRTLKAAHLFSNRMVTSFPAAYPYRHDKLSVIGQGVDTRMFRPFSEVSEATVLCAGRLSSVKNHPLLLRAWSHLEKSGFDLPKLRIIGSPSGPADVSYAQGLEQLVSELGLRDVVSIEPGVPHARLPETFARCRFHVNMTGSGSGDKVVLEAMGAGRPCVVVNPSFAPTLGDYADALLVTEPTPQTLAEAIARLLQMPEAERAACGRYLRSRIESSHGLDALAERILGTLRAAGAKG
jgi:glycosyltransferase involved in cell wall biosynthesis